MTLIFDGQIDQITPTVRIVGLTELTPILETKKEDISYFQFFLGFIFFVYMGKYAADIIIDTRKSLKDFLIYLPAVFIMEISAIIFTKRNMIVELNKFEYIFIVCTIISISFYLFRFIWPKKPIYIYSETQK